MLLLQRIGNACPIKSALQSNAVLGQHPAEPKQRCVDTAVTRYVHSTTPVLEWLMSDRIFKQGTAVNPSIGDKSGKHQHCQQDAAADCICNDFPDRDWVLSQYRAAVLAAVTPNRRLNPLRSPYPRRS